MKQVITVTGEIDADDLGPTLPHEHLFIDTSVWVSQDPGLSAIERRKLNEPVSMENLWWLSTYGRCPNWNSIDNRRLDDFELIESEVNRFKAEGGRTIIDVTPMTPGLGRDPTGMRRIAHATGLNVIAGTGHYIRHAHPPEMDALRADDIADEIVSDITEGIDETDVRAGIIGEIGATRGFTEHENEVKAFRAAAIAQERTGAAITIHPPLGTLEGHDLLDVLEHAGADLSNVIFGHLDAALELDGSSEYYQSLADRGVYLQFDTFGRSGYLAPYDICFPLDETRIQEIRRLFETGYEDHVLISQDICKKTQLTRYAGHGYDYILRDILPRLHHRGFKDADVRKLTVDNPSRAVRLET